MITPGSGSRWLRLALPGESSGLDGYRAIILEG